ncbi:nucleotidyltransferase family protein [Sphingomonas sp. ASV193]|uniref:nucleotidyltransferase family protein n=1 Tax=Sphingomonas sp. ASV193 TaxID=3144405 RepID=UPI0032E89ED6
MKDRDSGERRIRDGESGSAALVVAACCAAFDADADAAETVGRDEEVDISGIVAYARRHRVEGLARLGFERMAATPLAAALRDDAARIARDNLLIAVEMKRLDRAFAGAAIDRLFLKGLTLAALCYDAPMAKAGWDIDILVDEASLDQAANLLEHLDYRLVEPDSRAALASWHRRKIESVWAHRRSGLHVELHTRLTPSRSMLPLVGLGSPRQSVDVAGHRFETLADAPLLAYLAAHGASSLWFRLKWPVDFAAFAHHLGPRLETVAREADRLGEGRALRLALAVSNRLFATPVPPSLGSAGDRIDRWMLGAALDQLTGRRSLVEPGETRFGTAPIHLAGCAMPGTARGAWAEALRRTGDALLHRRS